MAMNSIEVVLKLLGFVAVFTLSTMFVQSKAKQISNKTFSKDKISEKSMQERIDIKLITQQSRVHDNNGDGTSTVRVPQITINLPTEEDLLDAYSDSEDDHSSDDDDNDEYGTESPRIPQIIINLASEEDLWDNHFGSDDEYSSDYESDFSDYSPDDYLDDHREFFLSSIYENLKIPEIFINAASCDNVIDRDSLQVKVIDRDSLQVKHRSGFLSPMTSRYSHERSEEYDYENFESVDEDIFDKNIEEQEWNDKSFVQSEDVDDFEAGCADSSRDHNKVEYFSSNGMSDTRASTVESPEINNLDIAIL
eukprot:Awhi_evm1s10222